MGELKVGVFVPARGDIKTVFAQANGNTSNDYSKIENLLNIKV